MDWKDIVKNIAPVVGGTIGGPFGAIGMKFLAGKLLGDENATEADIENAVLNASPELLQKLKLADLEFKKEMAELGFKEAELHVRDRESARDMAKVNMVPQIIMSAIYTIAYGIVLYNFMIGNINVPEQHQVLFGSLIGILTAAQIQILNFWFGSSSGSKEKTTSLTQQHPN